MDSTRLPLTNGSGQLGFAGGQVGYHGFSLQLTQAFAGAGFVAVGNYIAGGSGTGHVLVLGNGQIRHAGFRGALFCSFLTGQHQVSGAGAAEIHFFIGQGDAAFGIDGTQVCAEDDG